jgi:hypothetical protein
MNRTQESAMLLALAGVGAFGFWLWRRSKKKEAERRACEQFAIRYGTGRFRVTVEDDNIEGI